MRLNAFELVSENPVLSFGFRDRPVGTLSRRFRPLGRFGLALLLVLLCALPAFVFAQGTDPKTLDRRLAEGAASPLRPRLGRHAFRLALVLRAPGLRGVR